MEEVLMRFHQIGKKIFEELNNESLVNCREVNQGWREFIDGEKTVPFRFIKSCSKVSDNYLNKKFGRTSLDLVKELMKNVQHANDSLRNRKVCGPRNSPEGFNELMEKGYIDLDDWRIDGYIVMAFIVSKEDGTKFGVPVNIPFHENLMEQLNTGKLILTALGLSKPNPTNPANCGGLTLLHVAAQKGYLNVCKLIAENVQEKNPEDCFGVTPLQLAAKNGHSSLVTYFHSLLDDVKEPRKKRRKQDFNIPLLREQLKTIDPTATLFSGKA